jgi:hypothetical protein
MNVDFLSKDDDNNIDDIINMMEEIFKNELNADIIANQGLSMYVPLEASKSQKEEEKEKIFDIQNYIMKFINGDDNDEKNNNNNKNKNKNEQIMLLLQGDSGAGKSLFGKYLTKYLWNIRKSKDKDKDKIDIIPIFISLPQYYSQQIVNNNDQEEDIIKIYFENHFITLSNIYKKFTFLFILDGFDEIKNLYDEKTKIFNRSSNLYQRFLLYKWNFNNSKFIITCRTQVLNESEKLSIFSIHRNIIENIYLTSFSQKQIEKYIENFSNNDLLNESKWNKKEYLKTINEFNGLKEMIRAPFSLGLILKVLPRLKKEYLNNNNNNNNTLNKLLVYKFINHLVINGLKMK